MLTLWQAWEFKYSSDCSIHVINTPRGIEVFALDVLPIIFPELNGQYDQIPINGTKRIVVKANKILDLKNSEVRIQESELIGGGFRPTTDCSPLNLQFSGGLKPSYPSASHTNKNSEFWRLTPEFCLITMLDAVALHALSDFPYIGAKTKVIRKLMQWVRGNIKPLFDKNAEKMSSINSSKYDLFGIDYHHKESLINYLAHKGESWADKYINLYLQLIAKRIPLSTNCPIANDEYSQSLRAEYFQIAKLISNHPEPDSYEKLYERLVLVPTNLLMAQQLDFLVFNLQDRFQQSSLKNILKQGLFLQTLYSIGQKLSSYGDIQELGPLYLRLIKHFSDEVLKSNEETEKNG